MKEPRQQPPRPFHYFLGEICLLLYSRDILTLRGLGLTMFVKLVANA